MAYWIKHKFHSAKGDGTDSTLVKPSNWNDDHEFWMDEGTIIARPPGSGPGPGVEVPMSSLFPAGMVSPFAGTAAPSGWLICNGASLLRIDFPALFTAISTAFGAVDASHFSLPDLRGRVPAGIDGGVGRLTGATINTPSTIAGAGGQETEQAYADVNVGGRSYGATYGGGLAVHVEMDTWEAYGSMGTVGGGPAVGTHSHHMAGDFGVSGTSGVYVDVSAAGGGYTRAVSNVQPTLLLNFIIKT